ncbi:hypothetical protein Scep_009649 [Stephania cephalantha]|uniref:Uncharacterized protein n=1 Tax=Stephania cephalantha TaxID=152367 RepID=A0AAP0JV02_9MAGN
MLDCVAIFRFSQDIVQNFKSLLLFQDILDFQTPDFIIVPVQFFTLIELSNNVLASTCHFHKEICI